MNDERIVTGTNYSNAGSEQTTPTRARAKRQWLGLTLGLMLAVGLIIWMEISTWRQVTQLEYTFASARPTVFLLGIRVREGMERLGAALLRFRLSNDPSEREQFHAVARELTERLGRTILPTPAERTLAHEAEIALEAFLRDTSGLLEEGVRGVRRDTAAEVRREIQDKAAPVLAVADRLVAAQDSSAHELFGAAEQSLASLRRGLLASFLFFFVLIGVVAALAYRALITPLRMQLTETQAVMDRQERLASLGVLATGVAHEIRNPLAALKFRLFSLKKSLPAEFVEQEDLGVIHNELQRLERIVKDFLQFARPSEPVFGEVSVEPLLRSISDLLKEELQKRGIEIKLVPGDIPTVRADRDQLQQVLINLVQNAAEAIQHDGTITLSVRQGAARLSRQSEPVVILEVGDTGPGISPEVEKRIFDPFYSTKEGGTGMGLPIATRIVEKHDGFLQYSTRRGQGTIFSIVLPRSLDDESKPAAD